MSETTTRRITQKGWLSRRRVVQGGAALVGLGLAGCTASPSAPTAEPAAPATAGLAPGASPGAAAVATPAAARPKYGGTLRTVTTDPGTNEDPHQLRSALTSMGVAMAYSGLMQFKHGRDIKPGTYLPTGDLAESWEQPDDSTYIFRLRRGAKFQNRQPVNGREVTSADVLYSFQRAIDLKNLASLVASVQRMETPDPYTLKVTLSEPDADFLANISASALVVVAKEAVEASGTLEKGPHVGSGPWMVESVDPTTHAVVLVRNPGYFQQGLPYIERVEALTTPEPNTVIAAFRAKQLDVIGSGIQPQLTDPVYRANPNDIGVVDTPLYLAQDEIGFKSDAPPFSDARLRKAVVLAMDREALIGGSYNGFGRLTSGVLTPDPAWQLTPDTLKPLYKQDVAQARQLLAQAGQPNFEFELTVPTYGFMFWVTLAEQIQAQLKEAGITVKLKPLDAANFAGVVAQRGEFTAYIGSNGGRLTANQDLLNRYHSRGRATGIQTRYSNPRLDALIDEQRKLPRDPARRRALLEQIQRTVIEDNVIVSLASGLRQVLSWNYVKDFYVNGIMTDSPGAWLETWIDR
jgi:peptide/nickel transport system substrate-binding protein